jgi:hypothetical protein
MAVTFLLRLVARNLHRVVFESEKRLSGANRRFHNPRATSRVRSNSGWAAQGTSASRYALAKAAMAGAPLCGSRSSKTNV